MQQCLVEDPWCQRTEAVDDWRVTWAAADSQWWSSHQWMAWCLWARVCIRDGRFQHLHELSDYLSGRCSTVGISYKHCCHLLTPLFTTRWTWHDVTRFVCDSWALLSCPALPSLTSSWIFVNSGKTVKWLVPFCKCKLCWCWCWGLCSSPPFDVILRSAKIAQLLPFYCWLLSQHCVCVAKEQSACRVMEIRCGCICKCSCWHIQSSYQMHLVSVNECCWSVFGNRLFSLRQCLLAITSAFYLFITNEWHARMNRELIPGRKKRVRRCPL